MAKFRVTRTYFVEYPSEDVDSIVEALVDKEHIEIDDVLGDGGFVNEWGLAAVLARTSDVGDFTEYITDMKEQVSAMFDNEGPEDVE